MPDLTLSANVDTLLQAADFSTFRTSLGLTALATTTPGTGVATALAVNIGSAGAPVLFNGAGGTPSSMVGTNITGTAAGLTAGTASAVAVGGITGLGSGVGTFLATPSGANLATALTTALPATKGGTGLTSLGTGIASALGVNANAGGGLIVLADPGADRIPFWDASAGAFVFLTAGTGLQITGTSLEATGSAANAVLAAAPAASAGLIWISDGADRSAVATDTVSTLNATALQIGGVAITATGTEINFIDGVTSAIQTQLDAKAPLASPTFTGTPAAPTAAGGTNTTQVATTAFVTAAIAASGGGLTWRSSGTEFFDDFLSDSTISYPWTTSTNGAGASAACAGTTASNRPGTLSLRTGTSSPGTYGSVYQNRLGEFFGGGAFTFETSARVSTALSDGTDEYDAFVGYGDTRDASAQVDGIMFVYDRNVSVNWQLISSKASTRTAVDTGIPVVLNTWYRLRFEVNAAGTSVQAYVDDVASGSAITTNIPDTISNLCGAMASIVKSTGTADRHFQVDYIYFKQVFTTPR